MGKPLYRTFHQSPQLKACTRCNVTIKAGSRTIYCKGCKEELKEMRERLKAKGIKPRSY